MDGYLFLAPPAGPRAINSPPTRTVCVSARPVAVSCVVSVCRREHREKATEQRTRPQEPKASTVLPVDNYKLTA